jgi:glycosyltransferase involved in cell wall biosynthesis
MSKSKRIVAMPDSRPERPLYVLMTADAVGGVWTYALALASALRSSDVTFTIAVMGPKPSAPELARAEAMPNVRVTTRPYRLEWMPDCRDEDVRQAGRWLQRIADRVDPDIIHINGYAHAALAFGGRPVLSVAHSCVRTWWRAVKHESAPPAWNDYTRRVNDGLARSAAIVAPTQTMANALKREYAFASTVAVVPNGLPAPPHHGDALPRESCIFAAGRFWDDAKNLAVLDDIAPTLPWPIIAAGSVAGPDGQARPPRYVWHLGQIDHADVRERMAHAAIYVNPARYEPFGLGVLEAAQAGCALVLGDIPSLREIWRDAALYVDAEDRVGLHECLAQLIARPVLRTRLAAAARARASVFSDRRMANGYLAIYHALVQAHPRPDADAHHAHLGQTDDTDDTDPRDRRDRKVAACAW